MQADFDRGRFADDIGRWLEREGISYRAASALHPCLNPAMLSRAVHQRDLSVTSVLLLSRVAGLDPMLYLVLPVQKNQAVTAIESRETSEMEGGW
ncbi:hypothetical protein [Rhizobium sp. BK602]|uniref:hypothetical protein n=1 Tax=Rhizobium sp. BK602 TaxID=2586986 RepID=UPI0016158F61|nr:hypothetical protein [Rhizobium sp. BK602]MBB3608649.1 hypothetical protein [Rhizobium sp. BK602]